jgi:hypothetical protein
MISDLLTLTGVHCLNPNTYSSRFRARDTSKQGNNVNKSEIKVSLFSSCRNIELFFKELLKNIILSIKQNRIRPYSANIFKALATSSKDNSNAAGIYSDLDSTGQDILKTFISESSRANRWVRFFPSADSWEFYSQYLETRSTSYNMMLHKRIYQQR